MEEMNEFNELFNKFFGKKKDLINNETKNDRMNEIIKLMNKLNSSGDLDGMSPDEAKLGEPTSVKTYERDGVTFEESTWDTEFGSIIRITTKEDINFTEDFFNKNKIPYGSPFKNKIIEITLEEQLNNAVKSENYEEAAKLRDLIEKKDEIKNESKNVDNEDVNNKDEWNF